MAELGKPTLIHLANSASQSVLWLLEELGIEYDLRVFPRPVGPAPPELKETHPQGKSPQLRLADGRVITQLSAITLYLIRTYDKEYRFHRPDDDPVHEEQLVCIGVADMASKIGMKLLLHGLSARSPWFVRPLFSRVSKMVNGMIFDPDLAAIMGVLEMELESRDWFLGGEAPSRADFVLRFFVDLAVDPKYVDLTAYPRVKAWWERCGARVAWKRALEKGNGYNLDFPGMW